MSLISKLFKLLNKYLCIYKLKKRNVLIGKKVNFDKAIFEQNIKIYNDCNINKSHIGTGTYIANNAYLPNTKIGRFCSIGPNVRIAIGNHPADTFVSTHPAFFSILRQAGFTFIKKQLYKELSYIDNEYFVHIGNDVWIGANVIILNGIRIGDGAIIGAGAVVTKNIEPYTVNVGIPSKPLKKRFCDDDIVFLKKLKWWKEDFEWIQKHANYFNDIKLLRAEIKNNLNE